jgi:NAD+ kinase
LATHGARVEVRKAPHDAPISKRFQLVITVGGDGTLLATSHRLGAAVPLLGINSAPKSSVGFFCAGDRATAPQILAKAIAGTLPGLSLHRMRVRQNGAVLANRVLNEVLFCHASPAATSRYFLDLHGPDGEVYRSEEHRSSGVWIGPASGSTAAQKSAGGKVLPLRSRALQFVVRELYEPAGQVARHSQGLIRPGRALELRSKMQDARLFVDGHETVFTVALGDVLTMDGSAEPLRVLGMKQRRVHPRAGQRASS